MRAGLAPAKRTASPSPVRRDPRLEGGAVGAVADDRRGHFAPVAREPCDRLDQHVDALELPQFADEDEIGRVRRGLDRKELGVGDAVVHDAHQASGPACRPWRRTCRGRSALEQEQSVRRISSVLGRQVDQADRRAPAIVQAAAVGGVDADRARRSRQPRVGAALGAVAVQHVDRVRARAARLRMASRSLPAMSRLIGTRVRPSASTGASAASAASARSPPVVGRRRCRPCGRAPPGRGRDRTRGGTSRRPGRAAHAGC